MPQTITQKTAVVLFNLGGPDSPEAVKPFLFNLFNDKAIIGAPQPVRWLLARLISGRRAPTAAAIYADMGGRSPILPNTEAQASALARELNGMAADAAADSGEADGGPYRVFIAMRYWHPFTRVTVEAVKAWGAERVVLLPLYPQFSTTTTGSSAALWQQEAARAGLTVPTATVCCYPTTAGWIQALADGIRAAAPNIGDYRLLFSAHGLPQQVVDKGDPYQWQVERTAAAVVAALGGHPDPVVCYQSKVGPLKWLEPSTDTEIRRAGREGKPIIVVPVAFVSEHSETLVELDKEYRHLADSAGVPDYRRVPTVSESGAFIAALAGLARDAAARAAPGAEAAKDTNAAAGSTGTVASQTGGRVCPQNFQQCPCRA